MRSVSTHIGQVAGGSRFPLTPISRAGLPEAHPQDLRPEDILRVAKQRLHTDTGASPHMTGQRSWVKWLMKCNTMLMYGIFKNMKRIEAL